MSCASLFTLFGRQQGRDEPLRHDLELGDPGHYDDAGDARRKRTGFIMFLIQVENYFVIHSPEFFLRFFRSVGAPPVYWWQLVGAVISSTSFLLLIDIIFSSLQFSRIKGGVAATQLFGRLFSQLLHYAMQGEWECRKVYFRPCKSYAVGASRVPLSCC